MIGKIVAGSGAGGVTAYVTGKDGAQLLSSTWDGPAEVWASQIGEHTGAMGSGVAQTVVHVSLAAAPGERLSDDQWRAVSEEYLARMGWGGHDHAVVRHTDTDHDHVHIIVARVGHDGQTADLHDDYPRQARVLDSIERDFGLERTHEQIRIAAEQDPYRAIESATRSSLTFERTNIDRYFERLGFDADKTRELTDRAMRDDRVLFAQSGGVTDKFTTAEVRAEIQRLDSALRRLAGQEAQPTLDRGEAAREGLSDGQRAAADRIAAGGGLVVIEGFAGSGKSTMLRAAIDDLRFSGHDVVGVGSTGKAAKGLAALGGLESNTLTSTLGRIERGELKLTASSVVILDEAGMARNDELGALAQRVADAGGRLVLVGDDKQLGAVGRGGGFAHARKILGTLAARLDEIFRQREGWQRDASKAFGEGRAREAIQAYVDHGKVEWAASRGTARDMLVADYKRELERGVKAQDMLALAHENRDVKMMNREIRDAIQERGRLTGERTYKLKGDDGKTQKIALAAGDRVVFEKNTRDARGEEVKNGEFGSVAWVDSRGFGVRMDDGALRRVEDGSRQQMSHGYASTVHKSQGATLDKTFVLASKGMDSKLTYVSMSRQKEDTKLYANKTEFKNAEHLKNSLGRDNGRQEFKSVLGAGEAKALSRTEERDHAAGGRAAPERERQPVESYIAALAIDQRKVEPFGPRAAQQVKDGQGQQEKGKEGAQKDGQQARGQEREAQAREAQPAREVGREQGKAQDQQEKGPAREGQGQEQVREAPGKGPAQEKAKDEGHDQGQQAGQAREGQQGKEGEQEKGKGQDESQCKDAQGREAQEQRQGEAREAQGQAKSNEAQPREQAQGKESRDQVESQGKQRGEGKQGTDQDQRQGEARSVGQRQESEPGPAVPAKEGSREQERAALGERVKDQGQGEQQHRAPTGKEQRVEQEKGRAQERPAQERAQANDRGQGQEDAQAKGKSREGGLRGDGQGEGKGQQKSEAQERQHQEPAREVGRAGEQRQGQHQQDQRQAAAKENGRGRDHSQAGRQERDKSQGQETGQQARGREKAGKEQTKSKSKGYGL